MLEEDVIFLSHEWAGFFHADPDGKQTQVLCRVLERLKNGETDVEFDLKAKVMFNMWGKVEGAEWMNRMRGAWLWMDYISIPQVGAYVSPGVVEMRASKVGRASMHDMATDVAKAVSAIPGYVEVSTLMMVLAPECPHLNRKATTTDRAARLHSGTGGQAVRSRTSNLFSGSNLLLTWHSQSDRQSYYVSSVDLVPFWYQFGAIVLLI